MPGDSGVTVVTNSRVFYTTRGCGRIGRPAFPAPSDSEGGSFRQNSREIRGEIAKLWLLTSLLFEIVVLCMQRHSSCPDLIRGSIHLPMKFFRRRWIAGSSPAMTSCRYSRDPLTRMMVLELP